MSWYRGNIWKEGSPARESLKQVREFHSTAALRLNSVEMRPYVDQINISQCGPSLCHDQPLLLAIKKDFNAIKECPFLHLMHDNYKSFTPRSTTCVPYINQVEYILLAVRIFS